MLVSGSSVSGLGGTEATTLGVVGHSFGSDAGSGVPLRPGDSFRYRFSWQRESMFGCILGLDVKQTHLTAFGRHGHYATDQRARYDPPQYLNTPR